MTAIRFLKLKDPFGFFSNFWPAVVVIEGKKYPTNEHWYQSRKYVGTDPVWQEAIRLAPSAWDAMRMGRDKTKTMRSDWDDVKEAEMMTGLRAKFTQYPFLRAGLLSTGDREIIEASVKDSYWAEGPDGKGLNRLGKLIMELREEFRTEEGGDGEDLFG